MDLIRIDELEGKIAHLQDEQKQKVDELNNDVSDNNTRLSALEGQNYDQQKDIDEIKEDLKVKEDSEGTEKMMQDFMAKLQSDNLDTLSKRIDQNENHIKLLEEKDDQLDADMERVNENITNIDGRLDALEKADEFLRHAHEVTQRKIFLSSQGIYGLDFLRNATICTIID